MSEYCCAEFAAEVGSLKEPVGGGIGLYPASMRPKGQIQQDPGGGWHVNGCCGGGCYVLTDIRFCPFCGAPLSALPDHI